MNDNKAIDLWDINPKLGKQIDEKQGTIKSVQ